MPRYGGGKENFEREQELLRSIQGRLTEIEAKEAVVADGLEQLGQAEQRRGVRAREAAKARAEGIDVAQREAAVSEQTARQINLETEAIARNTAARQRRQQISRLDTALAGAGDPLFGPAAGIAAQGGGIRQYREQLGVGYGRARRIQDALEGGFAPAGPANAPLGPLTRGQAAQRATVEADVALAAAKRDYAAAVRRGAVEEAEAASIRREAAQQARQVAQAEATAAKAEIAARDELTAAIRTQAAKMVEGAAPGAAIIPHPTEYGRGFVSRQAIGQTEAEAQAASAQLESQATAARATSARLQRLRDIAATSGPGADPRAAYIARQPPDTAQAIRQIDERFATGPASRISQIANANAVAFQREGAALGAVSNNMHRHGALTQEFILAAARGEVTLRELGREALVTAGKFVGWTAAATAVFGLAGAIHEVAKGAIDAQSGAAGLSRFIPASQFNRDQAVAGFSRVSQQLNVPIADVAASQQGFARVFGNQRESLIAADTALKAFQLDQISAADSTRFFTAIVQEFQLPAERLPLLFDQISRAQRVMGARVAETLPAIARSAAAVKNAGGDLNELVALAATAQVASGQTGNVVGTAFTRAASNFSRNPVNLEVIKRFGVDTTHGFTHLLIDAVSKSQALSGEQRTELAKAIGGPQYGGRIFQTLLGQYDRLNKAIGETSPTKARGSAQEELNKKLEQADQQIKRVGIALQNLGAALGRAGAFDLAGVLLHGLNDVLSLAVKLVDIFNDLPKPLREAVTIMAELALLLRLAQRFGVTRGLVGTPLERFADTDRRTGLRVRRGLRDFAEETGVQAERTQQAAVGTRGAATRQALRAERAAAEATAAEVGIAKEDIAGQERLTALRAKAAEQAAISVQLQDRATALEAEALGAREIANAAQAESAAAQAAPVRSLSGRGVYGPTVLGVPNYKGVRYIGETPLASERVASTLPLSELPAPVAASRITQTASRADRLSRSLTERYTALRTSGALAAEEGTKLATAGRGLDAVATRSIAAARVATGGLSLAARGLGGMFRALGGLASGLGPIGVALIAGPLVLDAVQKHEDEIKKRLEATTKEINKNPSTQAGLADYRQQLQKIAADTKGVRAQAADPRSSAYLPDTQQIRAIQGQAAVQELVNLRDIQRLQAHARATGKAVPLQTYDQLGKSVTDDAKLRREGLISLTEFDRRMGLHTIEAKHLLNADSNQVAAAATAVADAQRASGSATGYRASLRLLDDKGLQNQVQAVAAGLQDLGGSTQRFAELRATYDEALQRWGHRTNSSAVLALSQARQSFFQGLQQAVQSDLDLALGGATTEAQRQRAYKNAEQEYTHRLLDIPRANVDRTRNALAAARSRAAAAVAAYRRGPLYQQAGQAPFEAGPLTGGGLFGGPVVEGADKGELRKAAEDAAHKAARFRENLAKFRDDYTAAMRKYREIIDTLKKVTAFQDLEQGRQINLAFTQSQTGDSTKKAAEAVDTARKNVVDAKRTGDFRTYRTAITNLNQALDQQSQAILNDVSANNALLQARAGSDPRAQAQAAIQAAQNTLAALRGARHPDPDAIKNAQAALIQAQNSQSQSNVDYAKQLLQAEGDLRSARAGDDAVAVARAAQAAARQGLSQATNRLERIQALAALIHANNELQKALVARENSRLDLLESETTDPVAQANIEVQKAHNAIRGTQGENRNVALAAYNRARQARQQASLQAREDTIDFEQQMGHISVQGAISAYEGLLRIHNLTKQQRRDIQLKIRALQQQGSQSAAGFDLDVSSLKLPTAYDVRKAWDPIRAQVRSAHESMIASREGISSSVAHSYAVQANIVVNVTDPRAAAEVYHQIDRALGTHVKQRLRARGLR